MSDKPKRIFLSPPHMSGREQVYMQRAFDENYITTVGANITDFEQQLAQISGTSHALALNSGTAAIHLALQVLNVRAGDEVLCSSFTFVATANPILYVGATPVFVDSEPDTWNMCPQALEMAILDRIQKGKKPKALILVHLYGMPAKLPEILALTKQYAIPVIEDAAEALGSIYDGKPLGSFGALGIFSFNGNKIITTSGGGALVSSNSAFIEKARFLATQAKDPAPYYQHSQVGFNYRLSNILAGVGLAQLQVLTERVQQRRAIYDYYRQQLSDIPTIQFLPEPAGYFSNRWLTCILLSPDFSKAPEQLRLQLEAENIEARPLWKPLHLQPLFSDAPYYGGTVAVDLFNYGLCLPSGSALSQPELDRVIQAIKTSCESSPILKASFPG